MSEQSTVDADVQVTEPSVPPPPPPDVADLPPAVSVAPRSLVSMIRLSIILG
jgi:Meckel syndrome type 1 protein